MKTKFLALLLALVGVVTVHAQHVPGTVTINGLSPDGNLLDGHPVVVSWEDEWMAGRSKLTVDVQVIGMVNGVSVLSYYIAHDTNANGFTQFMPRVPLSPCETYKIQVVWRGNGFPIAGVETDPFTITLEKRRSITAFSNRLVVKNGTRMSVAWLTRNIPADATMQVTLLPLAGSKTGALEQGEAQNRDYGLRFTISDVPPGLYYLKVFYSTEYGFLGAESQKNLLVRVIK